jgi:hypothetical protein
MGGDRDEPLTVILVGSGGVGSTRDELRGPHGEASATRDEPREVAGARPAALREHPRPNLNLSEKGAIPRAAGISSLISHGEDDGRGAPQGGFWGVGGVSAGRYGSLTASSMSRELAVRLPSSGWRGDEGSAVG